MKNKLFEKLYEYSFMLKSKIKVGDISDFNFENIVKKSRYILEKENINFKYLRKDAKRKSGSASVVINLKTHEVRKTLYIRKEDSDYIKANIFFHELSNFILDHNELKAKINKMKDLSYVDKSIALTKKQREFIVDTIAELFVYKISGKDLNYYSNESSLSKDSVKFYRWDYIRNSNMTKKQYRLCKKQIVYGLCYLDKHLSN